MQHAREKYACFSQKVGLRNHLGADWSSHIGQWIWSLGVRCSREQFGSPSVSSMKDLAMKSLMRAGSVREKADMVSAAEL